MNSLAEARALIAENILPLRANAAPLVEAFGRVLHQDICAQEDVPAFDRAAMDGYAIARADNSEKFRIVAEIQPGAAPKCKIKRGECARIFTGAQIPAGAAQVLMQENVRREGDFILPLEKSRATHIRRRGEDAHKGQLLLKSGMQLGAGGLALLAGLGVTRPKISPGVRVAHFATGNELVAPEEKLKPGQIRDSNSTLVSAFIRQFGGEMVRQERVADDFDRLLRKARALKGSFDLLLLSGGASVGDYDFGKKLLRTLGFKTHFTTVNMRPGKPLVFATRGKLAAFILPGNPVSHFVTLQVAVRVALERFSGAPVSWPLVKIRLAEDFEAKPGGRETFWPARLEIQNRELVARPLRWQSSGDVVGVAGANALLQLPADTKPPKAGEDISVLLLEVP